MIRSAAGFTSSAVERSLGALLINASQAEGMAIVDQTMTRDMPTTTTVRPTKTSTSTTTTTTIVQQNLIQRPISKDQKNLESIIMIIIIIIIIHIDVIMTTNTDATTKTNIHTLSYLFTH